MQEDEQVVQDVEMESPDNNNRMKPWPLHCDLLHTHMDSTVGNSFPVSNFHLGFS